MSYGGTALIQLFSLEEVGLEEVASAERKQYTEATGSRK